MNHHQIEKYNMYRKMLVFFSNTTFSGIWAAFARLVSEITNFNTLNTTLSNYIQQHQLDIKGVTQTKNDAFMAMVTLVVNKAQKAYVWAVDKSNDNLIELFDVQKSDFLSIAESIAFAKIKNIRDALSANITLMGSVQLAVPDVTAVNTTITAYQNLIGTVGTTQSHKMEGTERIESLMHPIDKSLDLTDRMMISSYSISNVDMVKEYLLNRNIEKLPTHHSGVYAHITDATTNSDLQGAVLELAGKSTTSDINGIAEIIKIKAGTFNASVSMKPYDTQSMKIVILRGRITKLEIIFSKTES